MPESLQPPTLLAHLVPKFASHPENVAVEALGHILAHSVAARAALADLLRDGGADVGPIARVTTQTTGEGGERPDLAAVDERGAERLLIEAKFWAGLTENQPVRYLERLPIDEPSALLVVGPESRRASLWAELRKPVDDADGFDWQDATRTPDLPCAAVGGGRRLLLTSWTALLGRMASRANGVLDTDAELDIRQLRGLADRMDEEAFLPLRSEELGPEVPRRLPGLQRLVGEALRSLKGSGFANEIGGASASATSHGRYVTIGGARAWFGIWYPAWASLRATPLWLQLLARADRGMPIEAVRRRLAPLELREPPDVIEGAPSTRRVTCSSRSCCRPASGTRPYSTRSSRASPKWRRCSLLNRGSVPPRFRASG